MKLNRLFLFVLALIVLVLGARYFFAVKEPSLSAPSISPPTTSIVSSSPPSTVPETDSSSSTTLDLNAHEKEQLSALIEIFQSKNDNDPRLDHLLKNLSEAVKAELMKKYAETKMEMRNERGTIAFLIARELSEGRGSVKDMEFLKNVLMEKPCLSLSDCSKPSLSSSVEEQHLEGIHETTAHYPQLMDLRYLKLSLESENLSPEMRASVIATLESARNSPNLRVVQEAQTILNSLKL